MLSQFESTYKLLKATNILNVDIYSPFNFAEFIEATKTHFEIDHVLKLSMVSKGFRISVTNDIPHLILLLDKYGSKLKSNEIKLKVLEIFEISCEYKLIYTAKRLTNLISNRVDYFRISNPFAYNDYVNRCVQKSIGTKLLKYVTYAFPILNRELLGQVCDINEIEYIENIYLRLTRLEHGGNYSYGDRTINLVFFKILLPYMCLHKMDNLIRINLFAKSNLENYNFECAIDFINMNIVQYKIEVIAYLICLVTKRYLEIKEEIYCVNYTNLENLISKYGDKYTKELFYK